MGTFISAFFSTFSSDETVNNEENELKTNSKSSFLNSKTNNSVSKSKSDFSEQPSATSTNNLIKRKSKPELLIHRPTTPTTSLIDSKQLVIHEFIWKYGGKEILLAGTFTNWQPSIPMVPCDPSREYWRALVELDPRETWEFKFVVDGVWRCGLDLPTVVDPQGNTNNIIYPETEPDEN